MPAVLKPLNGLAWATLLVGVLGFFVHVSFSSESFRNGVRTSCTHVDLGPFLVAGIGAVLAFACLRSRADTHEARGSALRTAALVGLVLAAVHVVIGVLIAASVTGPCS